MSYTPYNRRPFSRGRRPNQSNKKGTIHPSRYIHKAIQPQHTQQVVITHSFADFSLQPDIQRNIQYHGFTTPTPIQDQAIPHILEGRDLVGIANTGTGKTAAFLLPIIQKISLDDQQGALIVVPTRELATQIADELHLLARGMAISSVVCVGGVSIEPQIREVRKNPHIIIGTPGRLKDLIERKVLLPHMFTTIVLDEVDRMLDIGFVHDIRHLISLLPQQRQSLFFSATMTPDIQQIMNSFLTNPISIHVAKTVTNDHIDQDIVKITPEKGKANVLIDLLHQPEFERVIIFGRTKHGINKLEKILYTQGIRVSAIHGNKTQQARQRSLDDFKRGRVQALLATDVVARGIDVDNVTHVINYDEPATYEDYIHRIGRTGRAGKMGKALTFVQP
ncbi:hypothetical protein C5B42_04665 [Candidatus Cerribacteria bacterium 'Amazon FNV 2010 28 9']|uniref:ATP-dependent helicase n=1 Tax=Candidatus Cerribacteria bacterium 'Amazon FNV 2010 28 9' TaxID=2081795 RepID=A0A317JSV9_9BACT|nr:MAG: hypothetical protein C5B42_04665 [Candidatus Cerribacteria bacterium 'Amazon FNV 2010 28 9']